MERWIEHVCEPERLILSWQAPASEPDRLRWAVGQLSHTSDGFRFEYFSDPEEFSKLNLGRSWDQLKACGFIGYPAFNLTQAAHTSGVREAFMRRLPVRSRSDFAEYLRHFRIRPDLTLSDFTLLAYTEAKLPSDGFSLVNPLRSVGGRCDFIIEVAGHHWIPKCDLPQLAPGLAVEAARDPANEFDPDAVMLTVAGKKIGFVNRLQALAFHEWIDSGRVRMTLDRLNGKPDHPRAFVFVEVFPTTSTIAA